MSPTIERQVKKAQHRLWLNRWLRQWGWSLLFVTAAWTVAWIIDRLFFPGVLPRGWAALVGLGLSLVASVIWLILTCEPTPVAAAVLDEAAGLRERVSTGLHVQQDLADPFAQAVVADAERTVAGLSARKFIPVHWARSLSLGSAMISVAFLSLLLPEFDLLGRQEAGAAQRERLAKLNQVRSTVAKPVSVMREIEKKHQDLALGEDSKKLDDLLGRDRDVDAGVLRRETVKKLDRLQDALQQKAHADRFKALNEAKKRLKQLGKPSDPKTELGQLMEALSRGDFREAQKSLKEVQEKLAKRVRDGKIDAETARQMQKQLNELARKLQRASQDKQSERELQNAGLSKAEAKRVLDALAKKDPQQLEKMAKEMAKRLKDKGITEQQMKQMLEKIQQRQKACKQCSKLGQKMGATARQLAQGDTQGAQDELGEAAEMLDEMEQLEQALNEIESQMSQLDDARDELNEEDSDDGKCKRCNGTGFRPDGSPCPHCKGTGRCKGTRGGGGTRARDDSVETDTVAKKANIKTRKGGTIIGQRFVKGSMLKGQSEEEIHEAAAAAEIDATDALNEDRIPRRYREGIKRYFDRLGDNFQPSGQDEAAEGSEKDGGSDTDGKDSSDAGKPDD
jgi:ribosomal protein S20